MAADIDEHLAVWPALRALVMDVMTMGRTVGGEEGRTDRCPRANGPDRGEVTLGSR